MRKLATVRKIGLIEPIPNADRIELAHVDGWKSVVRKDEFKQGETIVYLEVDSFVPHEIAPFLTKEGKEPKVYQGISGERLKTQKLRGVLSQGLILKTDCLPFDAHFAIGDDVTEVLGIKKYEKPEWEQVRERRRSATTVTNVSRYEFPSCIPKTDQERIQNLVSLTYGIGTYKSPWFDEEGKFTYEFGLEVTEKLDGTSATFVFRDGKFLCCSRNWAYVDKKNTTGECIWTDMGRDLDLFDTLRPYKWYESVLDWLGISVRPFTKLGLENIAIQGEIIGPKIQGNKYGLKENRFYVYDIFDANKNCYLECSHRTQFTKALGLHHVPIINNCEFYGTTLEEFLEMADGESMIGTRPLREGLVFKKQMERPVSTESNIQSFKVISNKFLLKDK